MIIPELSVRRVENNKKMKRFLRLVVLCAVSVVGFSFTYHALDEPDWYSGSGWKFRQKITIPTSRIVGTHTDFPVFVNLGDLDPAFFMKVGDNGKDIRVTAADGTTELAREVVFVDKVNKTGEIHFKAPELSAEHHDFYIYFGNASASDYAVDDPSYGAQAVWSNGYTAVFHMQQTTSIINSKESNHGSLNADGITRASGYMGGALAFDGVNGNYITVPNSELIDLGGSTGLTMSAWANPTEIRQNGYILNTHNSTPLAGYGMGITSEYDPNCDPNDPDDHRNLKAWVLTNGWSLLNGRPSPCNPSSVGSIKFVNHAPAASAVGNWNYFVSTYDGNLSNPLLNFYWNAELAASEDYKGNLHTTATNPTTIKSSASDLRIGVLLDSNDPFYGALDEIRIASVVRSEDWISTEYNNQSNPEGFIEPAPIEVDPSAEITLQDLVDITPDGETLELPDSGDSWGLSTDGIYEISTALTTVSNKSITINGSGGRVTIRQTGSGERVLTVGPNCESGKTVTIKNVTLEGGDADGVGDDGSGGGLHVGSGCAINIESVIIRGNKAINTGGGIYHNGSKIRLNNVLINGNRAGTGGGGIYTASGADYDILHTTIAGNYTDSGVGGLKGVANGVLRNSIIAENYESEDERNISTEVNVESDRITHNLMTGYTAETDYGNLNADAQFVDAIPADSEGATTSGDYHLLPASPAVNAALTVSGGDNVSLPIDLDGEPRPKHDLPDIGAYESDYTIVATKLLVLVPGETYLQEAANGKTGSPDPVTAGEAIEVTIYAVDDDWNIISAVDYQVFISSADENATLPEPASLTLSSGEGTFEIIFKTSGTQGVTVSTFGNVLAEAAGSAMVLAGEPSRSTSTVTSSPSSGVVADGEDESAITVTVKDAYGNTVGPGVDVFLELSTGIGTLSPIGEWMTNDGGQFVANLTTTAAGEVEVTAYLGSEDDNDKIIGTATISFVAGAADGGDSGVTATSPVAVSTSSTVTVVLSDAYGNPVTGLADGDFDVAISGGTGGTVTESSTVAGTYTFAVSKSDNVAGTVEVTVTAGGVELEDVATISFVAGAASQLSITTEPSAAAQSGKAFVQQPAIQLRDAYGNAVSASEIEITATVSTGGTILGTATADTDEDGVATFSGLGISGVVGEYTITFGSSGLTPVTSGTVTLSAGDASATNTTAFVPAGTAGVLTTIIVTVKDASGNMIGIGGANVQAVVTGANIQPVTEIDNGDGTYIITYTPTRSGEDYITIKLNGSEISGSPYTSNVSHGALAELVLDADATDLASGNTRSITVTLKDAYGNRVTSGAENTWEVIFTQQGGLGSVTGLSTVDAENGIAGITLTGEKAGDVMLVASVANPALTSNVLMLTITVDKSGLHSAIDEANNLTERNYSSTSWADLQEVLEAAQEVYDNANVTQSEIDAAEQSLREAMANLTVDKTALQNGVAEANELSEVNYTPESWTNLQHAVTEAQAVLDNPNATQAEVDEALENLNIARTGLSAGNTLTAPTDVEAQAGDKQVQLTWNAPQNEAGAPITDYLIQYTTDNGATWHTIDNGISVATEATLTGLTNNLPYRFRVAALNAAGTGAFSAATSEVVPSAPVPDQTGELPNLQPGETVVIIDGQPASVTLEVIDDSYLHLSDDGFAIDLTSIGINDQIIPITDVDAVIRIVRGQGASVRVNGYGFEPGTVVTLYIFSTSQLLGHIPVQTDGTFNGTLPIPADLELGYHTLQANGVVRDTKEERSVSVGVLVVEKFEQQVTFNALPNVAYGAGPLTLDAASDSGLPVSYRVTDMEGNGTDIASVINGNKLRINGAGRVRVVASQPGDGHYAASNEVVQSLVISRAGITVTAESISRPYGQENPAVKLRYSDFVNGDTEAAFDQKPLAVTTATPASDVGEYPITMGGGQSRNYEFTYVGGTLTIEPAHQQITFNADAELSRDAGRVPLDVQSSSGLPVTLSLDDEQVATLEGTLLEVLRIGTVRITAAQEGNGNYYAADPVTVTIHVTNGGDFPVRIHKAVSPNGDGINEFLMIEGIRDYPENRVTIFNRNGTVLYETTGYDNGSNVFRGISTGQQQLPAGTYFYVIEIKDHDGKLRAQKGYFVMRY